MRPEDRTTILVIGGRDLKDHTEPFTLKGLRLEVCDLADLTADSAPGRFASAKALLVAEAPGKFGVLSDAFSRLAPWAVSEGVALGYFPNFPTDLKRAAAMMADAPFLEKWEKGPRWVYLEENIQKLAEMLGRHDPGPGTGSARLALLGQEFELPSEHRQLLRRAFWDATDLAVEKLSGGASAPGAYRVYASLRTLYGRQEPAPFVFKVDRPPKIFEECHNYREFVQPYVPFPLRPGLIEARCVQTPSWASLTCNFVEGAVPLETALSNGHGAGAIHSLFEITLRRFRHQTQPAEPRSDILARFVSDRVKIAQLRSDPTKAPRIARAQRLGFVGEPEEFQAAIARRAEGMSALHVVIHGDLHMGNVMVRHKDAIVIDFGSMRHEGPVTADPAALEASIAFGTRKEEAARNQPDWVRFIDGIYAAPLEPPVHTSDHFHFAWVNQAIREVRSIVRCCRVDRDEALLVLAASLLRYGRFSAPSFNDPALLEVSEERKAYAMVKAQQVFGQIGRP